MNELFTQVQQILVSALAAVIVTLITMAWKYLRSFLVAKIEQVKSKTNSDLMANILDRLTKICDDVSISFDPVAEKMKAAAADGKLTPEEIKEIQDASRGIVTDIAKELFSQKTLDEVGITDEVLQQLIARGIEASVQKRQLDRSC